MEHILIVEDEEILANLLERALEREDYEVSCAPNVQEGMMLALQHHPSLAIIDLRLPMGNGFILIEHFRADPQFEDIPIIILTADVTMEAQGKAKDLDCLILAKPYPYQDLMTIIHELLEKPIPHPDF